MFCEKCGQELGEGLAFCPNCGAPVAAAPAPQQEAPVVAAAAPQPEAPVQAPAQEYQQPQFQQPQFQQPQQPQYQQPQQQYQQPQYQQPVIPAGAQKSKLAAGLLAIFLGSLGVHNFYLGFTKRAVIQLLVSLLTFGIGAPVIAVWALIEGIFYLTAHEGYTTDAKGVPLGE